MAAFSHLRRENAHCSSLPVDLTEETLMVTLKRQTRTHTTSVFLPSWPNLPSVQCAQKIPLSFHKVALFIGNWRGLESVAEDTSTLSLNLGHTTEGSRKLAEGEEKRLSVPAQPSQEGPSKEMRFPFQCASEKQKNKSLSAT